MATAQEVLPPAPITDLRRVNSDYSGQKPIYPVSFLNWLERLKGILLDVSQGDIILPFGNRAVVTDSDGKLAVSDVTDTEISYLDGVTSAIQPQINSKLFVSTAGGNQAWNDALGPVTTLRTVGQGVPSFGAINSSGMYGWDFTNEGTENNEKRLFVSFQLSHSVVDDSDCRLHVHFVSGISPGSDQTVQWEAEWIFLNDQGDLCNAARTYTLTNTTTIEAAWSDYEYHIDGSSSPPAASSSTFSLDTGTIPSTTDVWGSTLIGCLLRRKSSTDTYTDSVYVVGIDVHTQFEKAGSLDEFPT